MGPRRRRHRRNLPPPGQLPPPQLKNYCANCSSHCVGNDHASTPDNNSDCGQLICEISIVNVDEESERQTIKVYDVLSSIYKLDYLYQLRLMDNNKRADDEEEALLSSIKKIRKNNNDNNHDDDDPTSIGVCVSCAENLTCMFNYYQQFARVTSLDSFLSKKIKKLNDIIHHLEVSQNSSHLSPKIRKRNEVVQDEPPEINDEQSQSNSIWDNNALNTVEFNGPVKLELSDDDDYLNDNYDILDSMSTEDKPEDHDEEKQEKTSQNCSKVSRRNNNNKNKSSTKTLDDVTTTTTAIKLTRATDPFPFVKLCALTDFEIEVATTRKTRSSGAKHVNYNEDDILYDIDLPAAAGGGGDDDEEFDITQLTLKNDDDDDLKTDSKKMKKRGRGRRRKAKPNISEESGENGNEDDKVVERPEKKKRRGRPVKPAQVSEEEKDFNCVICNESLPNPSVRFKHVLDHVPKFTENMAYPCPAPDCSRTYTRKLSMIVHLRTTHFPGCVPTYICPEPGCGEKFSNKNQRSAHMLNLHRPEFQHYCLNCKQYFATKDALLEHQSQPNSSCHPDKFQSRAPSFVAPLLIRRICPAPVCEGKIFKNSTELKAHLSADHPGEKLYVCTFPDCSKTFPISETLAVHIKYKHTKEYCYQQALTKLKCRFDCKRRFSSQRALDRHEKECTGRDVFVCSVCSATLYSRWYFSIHMSRHYGAERTTFTCTVEGCGKTFASRSGLRDHEFTHDSSKHFVCDQCGKVSTNLSVYKSHMLMHSENKTHLCPHCGKAFLRAQGLRKHLRVHSDQKNFECQTCHKVFPYIESLNYHLRREHIQIISPDVVQNTSAAAAAVPTGLSTVEVSGECSSETVGINREFINETLQISGKYVNESV